METSIKTPAKVIGFVDIGTNAVRLLVVRINPNLSYTIVSKEKEVIRLGEQEFKDNILRPAAIQRAIFVCKKFAELAKTYGANQVIAVGTSAIREATNQCEFLGELHSETGLDVEVIAGQDEARLVWLGISSGIDIGDKKAIFIDLGGGSTEIAIGNAHEYFYLNSLRLGAIRITAQFIGEGWVGSIGSDVYNLIKDYAARKIQISKSKVLQHGARLAWGSSGTLINLAEVSHKLFKKNGNGNLTLTKKNLKKLAPILCSLSLDERKKLPAINPDRADIIIAGAAVIEAIMEELGLEEIHISHRELRDGLLVEYLSSLEGFRELQKTPMRERSVLQLGRSCNFDEKHAEKVTTLALQLFDSAKQIGLHNMSHNERELLKYAATLHDVGDFLSFSDHHLHSDYIISNSGLLGFEKQEIVIMACVARFHRKKLPTKKYLKTRGLDDKSKEIVIALSAFARFAEKLDRSHSAEVKKAEFIHENNSKDILLRFFSESDCSFEEWSVIQNRQAFFEAFQKQLNVQCKIDSA
jgi:exopolyphosphatase / guanosine-5'-triphosphate,3'-diphosphate pyrophosphatase